MIKEWKFARLLPSLTPKFAISAEYCACPENCQHGNDVENKNNNKSKWHSQHQATVWPVLYAFAQPYNPGSGSHGQLFCFGLSCPWLPLPGWYGCAHALCTGQTVGWCWVCPLLLLLLKIKPYKISYLKATLYIWPSYVEKGVIILVVKLKAKSCDPLTGDWDDNEWDACDYSFWLKNLNEVYVNHCLGLSCGLDAVSINNC